MATAKLSHFFSGSGNNREQENILAGLDVTLVLFENYLIDTQSGNHLQLNSITPSCIAEAAATLLASHTATPSVLLLLPATEFIGTAFNIPINSERMLIPALKLQAHSLFPTFEGELLLAASSSSTKATALWHPAFKADTMFQAFQTVGLFLAALMPRSLALAEHTANENISITDEDSSHCLQLHLQQGSLQAFMNVSKIDLHCDAFVTQWTKEGARIKSTTHKKVNKLEDWLALKKKIPAVADYCFFPAGVKHAAQTTATEKRLKLFGGIAIAAMLLLSLPFITNWVSLIKLESALVEQQELASEARSIQGSILTMEDEWGPIIDYPKLQIVDILLTLNNIDIIQNGLSSMSIDGGQVDIAGTADDPAYLVELLAQHDEFYAITQSRSISGGNNSSSGNRFGLRMNLTGVDFEDFNEKYPEVEY